MDLKKIATILLVVGGLVHLALGLGQSSLVNMIPMLGLVQIVVGVAAVYVGAGILKK